MNFVDFDVTIGFQSLGFRINFKDTKISNDRYKICLQNKNPDDKKIP